MLRHSYILVEGVIRVSSRDNRYAFRKKCGLCRRKTEFYCKDCDNGFNKMNLCLKCWEKYHKDLFIKIEEKKRNRRQRKENLEISPLEDNIAQYNLNLNSTELEK